MSDPVTLSGTVADVFAHRFTLATEGGTVLADLGPKGAERVALRPGDAVTIAGERKPSEVKVLTVTRAGETVEIPHGPKPHERKPHERKPHEHKPHEREPHGGPKPHGTGPRGVPAGATPA